MKTELTREQAVKLAESRWWVGRTDEEIVKVQLFEDWLVMPLDLFYEAVGKVLGRPVWNFEFSSSNVEKLQREFLKERAAPTPEEIVALLGDKTIVVIG